jgi:hypothetical protein
MHDFRQYRNKKIAELRPYMEGEPLGDVSVSKADADAGSPKVGDMIARNPKEPLNVALGRYWITSSAVANSVSGMVRPSALAVLRLMTRSIFVTC